MKKVNINTIIVSSVCILLFIYALGTSFFIHNASNNIHAPNLTQMEIENAEMAQPVVNIITTIFETTLTSIWWFTGVLVPVGIAIIIAILLIVARFILKDGKSGILGYRIMMGIIYALFVYLIFKMAISSITRLSVWIGLFAIYLFAAFITCVILTYAGNLIEEKNDSAIK